MVLWLFLGLVVVFGGLYVAAHYVAGDKVARGTTVSGVRIGGHPQDEAAQRLEVFGGWSVTAELFGKAQDDAIFLHCLPAYRGKEVDAEVIDGPRSVVWDEAENRRHVQKAVLAWLLEGE